MGKRGTVLQGLELAGERLIARASARLDDERASQLADSVEALVEDARLGRVDLSDARERLREMWGVVRVLCTWTSLERRVRERGDAGERRRFEVMERVIALAMIRSLKRAS